MADLFVRNLPPKFEVAPIVTRAMRKKAGELPLGAFNRQWDGGAFGEVKLGGEEIIGLDENEIIIDHSNESFNEENHLTKDESEKSEDLLVMEDEVIDLNSTEFGF